MQCIKDWASVIFTSLQNLPGYRRMMRGLALRVKLYYATDDDMRFVHRWFAPESAPTETIHHDPCVVNWVAKNKKQIIGFVQLVNCRDNPGIFSGHWLFSLYVMVPWRGLGVGERLCGAVIERARKDGAQVLSLFVAKGNLPAIHLYKGLGFQELSTPELEVQLEEEFNQTGHRRILMQKKLGLEE